MMGSVRSHCAVMTLATPPLWRPLFYFGTTANNGETINTVLCKSSERGVRHCRFVNVVVKMIHDSFDLR
jgi:hypothetical protein